MYHICTLCCIVGFHFSMISIVICRVYQNNVRVWYHLPSTASFFQLDGLMERGFGFLAGGNIHFTMKCPAPEPVIRPSFWLLYCNTSNARELVRMTYSRVNLDCRLVVHDITRPHTPFDNYCYRERVFVNGTLRSGGATSVHYSYHKQMSSKRFYTLFLLQCPLATEDGTTMNNTGRMLRSCESSLLAQNPGGIQLSSDEISLPLIYTVINLVWACLLSIWFFNCIIFFKYSNRLHRLVSCAPTLKLVLVVLVLLWWMEVAHSGNESVSLASMRNLVQSVTDSLFFVTLMVVSEGWGIVRNHIVHYRWTALILLFSVFAVSLMCVHWVHRYFLAFSVCCVVFIMYKALKWSSHNIELLHRRRRKLRRFIARHGLRQRTATCGVTVDDQLGAKLKLFCRFRIVTAAFSTAYAVSATLATFLHEHAYVRALARELPELVTYVATGFLLRLRDFSEYQRVELIPPRTDVALMELPDVSRGVCSGTSGVDAVLAVPLAPPRRHAEKQTQTAYTSSHYWKVA